MFTKCLHENTCYIFIVSQFMLIQFWFLSIESKEIYFVFFSFGEKHNFMREININFCCSCTSMMRNLDTNFSYIRNVMLRNVFSTSIYRPMFSFTLNNTILSLENLIIKISQFFPVSINYTLLSYTAIHLRKSKKIKFFFNLRKNLKTNWISRDFNFWNNKIPLN